MNSVTTTYVPYYVSTGNKEVAFLLFFFIFYHIDYLGVYYAYIDPFDTGTICMYFCQNTVLF